jgi:drug/metabolite transporter (DMT)-like permease
MLQVAAKQKKMRSSKAPEGDRTSAKTARLGRYLLVLLLSVALNSGGQLLFKAARFAQPDASITGLFAEAYIWIGLALYGLSSISWLWVLARAQLSFAYPVLALSFPIVAALSGVLFGETVVPVQWAGVGLVIVGVSLLSRT